MTAQRKVSIRGRASRFFRRSEGTASVEFALMLPLFLSLACSALESGILMTRYVMLERALDMTVRELRLGTFNAVTEADLHEELKKAMCKDTLIFSDCNKILMLELTNVSTATWSPLPTNTTCVDRSNATQTAPTQTKGGNNDLMLLRACIVFDPLFPWTGVGLNFSKNTASQGGYLLVARSAFANEPNL